MYNVNKLVFFIFLHFFVIFKIGVKLFTSKILQKKKFILQLLLISVFYGSFLTVYFSIFGQKHSKMYKKIWKKHVILQFTSGAPAAGKLPFFLQIIFYSEALL